MSVNFRLPCASLLLSFKANCFNLAMESVSPLSLSVPPVVNISPLSSLFPSSSPLNFPSFSCPTYPSPTSSPTYPSPTLPVNLSMPPPLMPIPSSPRFLNNYKDDRPNQTYKVKHHTELRNVNSFTRIKNQILPEEKRVNHNSFGTKLNKTNTNVTFGEQLFIYLPS